jgi:hypothetical protein
MIKRFKEFIKEEVSGTELVGPVGPAYGETRLQNKTISSSDTNVIFCDLDSKFYTEDDYNELYNNYLKDGGKPIPNPSFSLKNIERILSK